MKNQNKSTAKIAIIILATLLAISVFALIGTLIYKNFANSTLTSVVIPENIITPDKENSNITDSADTSESKPYDTVYGNENTATVLRLYNNNPKDNAPFNVGNMFPGDASTEYFCVEVSHNNTVDVYFNAEIKKGYEELAKVLKTKIVLKNTEEVLYNGLIGDMPKNISCTLSADKRVTNKLYYEITAYLETRVGNEYIQKELKADFNWWVNETENLDSPETGDTSDIIFWLSVMLLSLVILIALLAVRKKEKENAN